MNYNYERKIFLSDSCNLYSFITWYNDELGKNERVIKIGGEDKTRKIEWKCLSIQKSIEVLQDLKEFEWYDYEILFKNGAMIIYWQEVAIIVDIDETNGKFYDMYQLKIQVDIDKFWINKIFPCIDETSCVVFI